MLHKLGKNMYLTATVCVWKRKTRHNLKSSLWEFYRTAAWKCLKCMGWGGGGGKQRSACTKCATNIHTSWSHRDIQVQAKWVRWDGLWKSLNVNDTEGDARKMIRLELKKFPNPSGGLEFGSSGNASSVVPTHVEKVLLPTNVHFQIRTVDM